MIKIQAEKLCLSKKNSRPPFNFFINLLLLLLLFTSSSVLAQNDTIQFKNKNILIGEIKGMENGVLTIKTNFSDKDFKAKWKQVQKIATYSEFLISIYPGKLYNGALNGTDSTRVFILHEGDTLTSTAIEHVLSLKQIKRDFVNNFQGEISLGYNFTKAERSSELSIRSQMSYRAKRWKINGQFKNIISTRKESEEVHRLDASLNYNYFLKQNWFTVTQVSWFSNTEQQIKLRTVGLLGIGKMAIQNDKLYWGIEAGATYNNEKYNRQENRSTRNSAEAFVGSELNIFDLKNFGLLTRAVVYPSFTDKGRVRFDYNLDLKYDLPLHFFIKLGFTFNYDNRPVEQASSTDYIFQTTLGWSFN